MYVSLTSNKRIYFLLKVGNFSTICTSVSASSAEGSRTEGSQADPRETK